MAILSRAVAAGALVAAGCYEPQLADCVVSCTGTADCAPGQVCGSDRMCSAPETAGTCTGIVAATDAGTTDAGADARTADASITMPIDAAPIDAPLQVVLQIEIKDQGVVTVQSFGTCSHTAPMHICQFGVPAGLPRLLIATPALLFRFEKWEDGPCVGQDATCTMTPTALFTEVKAKFKRL